MNFFTLMLFAASISCSATMTAEYTCLFGYTEYGGYCYRLYSTPLNQSDAVTTCLADDAELASIHNNPENIYVQNLGPEILIGLQYEPLRRKFIWTDGTKVDMMKTVADFVKNSDYLGYCSKLVKNEWANAECNTDAIPFVCKKKAKEITVTSNNNCPNGSLIYKDAGLLLSPGYPQKYDGTTTQLTCIYRLASKNNSFLKVKFEEIEVGTDVLEVYDQWNTVSGNLVANATAARVGSEFNITSNLALLRFVGSHRGTWKVTFSEA